MLALKLRNAVRLEVASATLDWILDRTACTDAIGLVKVDVEGDELAVLAGAARTLRRAAHVIVEVNGTVRGREVTAVLRDAGLRVAVYQSDGYRAATCSWSRDRPRCTGP